MSDEEKAERPDFTEAEEKAAERALEKVLRETVVAPSRQPLKKDRP